MRNEVKIGHLVQGKHAMTILSLTCKIKTVNASFIKGTKKYRTTNNNQSRIII